MDFDEWYASPYTKELNDSIANDYVPRTDLATANERIRELSAICDEVGMIANENGYDSIAALIEWFPVLAKSYDQLAAEREVSDKLVAALKDAEKFIVEITSFGGKYAYVNGTELVRDAYASESAVTAALADAAAIRAKQGE